MSVADLNQSNIIDQNYINERKVNMRRKNDGNKVYEDLEFDPLKK
jgi:hypothetical protein